MQENKKSFYITSPLYYVNDLPHIGSAYTTIACDTIARYYRLRGYETFFLTGSDEHGQKIYKSAKDRNKTPIEHSNEISNEYKKLWKKLNINYSSFIRTSSDVHKEIVKDFFLRVFKNGDIYEANYDGLYCLACEDFKLEKDLIEKNLCSVHKVPVEVYSEKNYFFALSKYEDRLKKFIIDNNDFIQPEYRKNEVMGWINEGLRDFPITRRNVEWGIPVPVDESQTIYVWFDALLGYLSGLLTSEEPTVDNAVKKIWPCSVHVIGKDILRFHAVYWPCMLMSCGLPLPKKVFGHGFLTKDGEKMGKTTGNIINPHELIDEFGSDAIRFYFLRDIVFGRDGDFSRDHFIKRINADLANNLGNLLNRSLNLIYKNFNSTLTRPDKNDYNLKESALSCISSYEKHMENLELKEALDSVWQLIDKTNKNFNDMAPWKLISQDKESASLCLYETLEVLSLVSILISPFIPDTSKKIQNQLGNQDCGSFCLWTNVGFGKRAGYNILRPEQIFPKFEI